MNKTALIAAVAAVSALTAPAFAGDHAMSSGQDAIRVQLCEVDAISQPAFRSVDGARPVFVTADEVLAARAAGERWAQTRCMTPVQHQRLTNALRERVVYRAETPNARFR
jgi:hypothetical protein